MKYPHHPFAGIMILTMTWAAPAKAQTTLESRGREEDAPVALSPFVVNTERDTGYEATSTMAGTRLNTPISELGASISIYTKTLMDDLGVTNSNDLLLIATGMEAAGPRGTFPGASNDIHPEPGGGNATPVATTRALPMTSMRSRW